MAREQTPWACLGVPEDATREMIDVAYRKLATRYHPDKAMRSDHPELTDWVDPYPQLVWPWIEGAYRLLTDETAMAAYRYRRRHGAPSAPPQQPAPRMPAVAADAPNPLFTDVVTPAIETVKRKVGDVINEAGRGILEGTFDWMMHGKRKK